MSNIEKIEQIVETTRVQFEPIAKIHGAVNFIEEAHFALSILTASDYLMRVADGNPDSLKRAIINVASVGLSLNPVTREAYLVPRKPKNSPAQICLDVSYVGYIKLGIESGGLLFATPELVKEGDVFEYRGVNQPPLHKFDPFGKRGKIRGGYVLSTVPGGFIMTHMSIEDIEARRKRSPSYDASFSPWISDYESMAKKTIIREAHKYWPNSGGGRMKDALRVIEEADPILLNPAPQAGSLEHDDMVLKIRTALEILGRSEEKALAYFVQVHRRNLSEISDLTIDELKQSLISLNQMIDTKNAKGK